jgi:phenylalanine-4-hydroxylase
MRYGEYIMSNFLERKQEIIAMATGPNAEPGTVHYTAEEHATWRIICEVLRPMWNNQAADRVLMARDSLDLPSQRIPQLTEVTQKLTGSSGFEFRAIGGLGERDQFFGALRDGRFLSTQFIRSPDNPFYTPEPDVVHEVLGHGTLLADPELAQLHRLAGTAMTQVELEQTKQFIANVWWFSGEFGVTLEGGKLNALGAGILSSISELQHMNKAAIGALDIAVMGLTAYRIDRVQPRLFAGGSVAHTVDVVGEFFERASDDLVASMMEQSHD